MKRKVTLAAAIAVAAALAVVGCAGGEAACGCSDGYCAGVGFDHRSPNYAIGDADAALDMLREGNRRFVQNDLMPRTTNVADRAIIAEGQWPFAVVITCSDSRVAPEIYFDQKQGDIFVVRNAGNIADETALGSLEFAVAALGARLIVVVGHDACGAVIHAHAGTSGLPANLQGVLGRVAQNIPGSETYEAAIDDNVVSVVNTVAANEVVQEHGARVVGARFQIGSGRVIFFD